MACMCVHIYLYVHLVHILEYSVYLKIGYWFILFKNKILLADNLGLAWPGKVAGDPDNEL